MERFFLCAGIRVILLNVISDSLARSNSSVRAIRSAMDELLQVEYSRRMQSCQKMLCLSALRVRIKINMQTFAQPTVSLPVM